MLGFGGQPAESSSRLIVSVFGPQDHQQAIVLNFGNQLSFVLPAGRYDVRMEYGAGLAPPSGGTTTEWLHGVEIQAGQTTTETHQLRLGELAVNFVEAPGKEVDAGNFILHLTPPGEPQTYVVTGAFMDSATIQVPPGDYDVFADYGGTDLLQAPGATVVVQEGQSITQTVDLKLARVRVEVYDAPGQFSAATREDSFASLSGANPPDLIVRAGAAYDAVVKLDGKTAEANGITLEAGTMKVVQLNASDFK